MLSLASLPAVQSNMIYAAGPPATVYRTVSGLVVSDSMTDGNSSDWDFNGSAVGLGAPHSFSEDSSGLHLGLLAPSANNWAGYFGITPLTPARLFHAKITLGDARPTTGVLDTAVYVQQEMFQDPRIDAMGCGADIFPAETHWTVSLQAGDAEHEIVNQSIYTDNSPNQPTSRECTLITNGDNQLIAYIDGQKVFSSNNMNLNMPEPFQYYIELQTNSVTPSAGSQFTGTFTDYYATTSDSIKVENAGAGSVVRVTDAISGNTLASSTADSTGTAFLDIGRYHMPINANVVVYDSSATDLLATTATAGGMYGGDVYHVGSSALQPAQVTINAVDLTGANPINGLATKVSVGVTNAPMLFFTPVVYSGTQGTTYIFDVQNFGTHVFDHWDNGSKVRARMFTPTTSAATLTASYRETTDVQPPTSVTSMTQYTTGINTPAIIGTASQAGQSIQLFDGPNAVGSPVIAAITTTPGGNTVASWSITPPALSDGRHVFSARATDLVSGATSTFSAPITMTIDTVLPTLTITGNSVLNGRITIVGTSSDSASGVKSVSVQTDAVTAPFIPATQTAIGDWSSWTFTTAQLAVGSHHLLFRVTDYAGNASTLERDFAVGAPDATAPATTATPSGTLGANGWYVSAVQVTLSATDNAGGSGVAETRYSLDGGANYLPYSSPFTITTGGTTTVQYFSRDNVGNVENVQSMQLRIDTTRPTISSFTGSITNNAQYAFGSVPANDMACSATDLAPGSGINSNGCVVTGYSTASGPQTLTANAMDIAGNAAIPQTISYTVGQQPAPNQPPVLDAITSPVTINELAQLAFTAHATDADNDPVAYSLSDTPAGASINSNTGAFSWTPTEIQGPGDYTFRVHASDGQPTHDVSLEIAVHVNEVNSSPMISNPGTQTFTAGSAIAPITFTASDPDKPSNVLTFSISGLPAWAAPDPSTGTITGTPLSSDAGSTSVTVTVSDNVNPTPLTAGATFTIQVQTPVPTDTIAPTTTATPSGTLGANGWYVSAVQVTLSATDNAGGSGVAETRYNLDQSSTYLQYAGSPVAISAQGATTVQYFSRDNAGNSEQANSMQVRIDAARPTIASFTGSITNNAQYAFGSVPTNNMACTASDPAPGSGINSSGCVVTGYSTAPGPHTLTAAATDLAGNAAIPQTIAYTVGNPDTTAPTVTGTPSRAPDSNGAYTSSVTITWTGVDNAAGSGVASCDALAVYSGPPGTNIVLTGHCTDNAGNVGTGTFTLNYASPSTTSTLTVRSLDTTGNLVTGMWTVLSRNGVQVGTGFTPVTFTLNSNDQYSIGVGNYGTNYFNNWGDNGSTAQPRSPYSITSNTVLYAVYRHTTTPVAPVLVDSSTGTIITGPSPPAITLNPATSATAGSNTNVAVTGTRFPANTNIVFRLDGTNIITPASPVTSSAAGGFGPVTITIPAALATASNAHTISATAGTTNTGQTASNTASANFAITTPPPFITLSPNFGTAGTATVVTVAGNNFPINSNVVFRLDGVVIQTTPGTPATSNDGALPSGLAITIPATAATGGHTVSVTAGTAATASTPTNSAIATFTVNPLPSITLNPSSAQSGTTTVVTISGTGFAANSNIVVRFDSNIVQTYPTTSTTITPITTNGVGSFIARFTVTPAMSSATGNHPVTATAGTASTVSTPTNSATAMFGVSSSPPPATTSTLTIRSINTSGDTITGMWTFLQRNGANVDTGFTQKTFTLTSGVQYTVGVGNYGATVFDHWQDNGSTSSTRSVNINSNTSLVAVYRVG